MKRSKKPVDDYKGYSGVVIYTRNATCAPIRAEEGITGVLCPPNSSTPYRELPADQQIGGYPTAEQLSQVDLDAATLDSEGRCVILEFPAFVLLGVYSPANRDESRDGFRQGFVSLLDARVRNLVAMGKRVILAGDLNIASSALDSAPLLESIKKGATTEDEFVSVPTRRIFNQLVEGAKVVGPRDPGREQPVLYDICRGFHPDRKGMYTCWETRVNARPGNYGARIDYVLSSLNMRDWWIDSNIQEGLLVCLFLLTLWRSPLIFQGSDHCPVYAVLKDRVKLDGTEVHVQDIMNPPGMFRDGQRLREYTAKDILPLSGRMIPEFNQRRSIKDMFTRKSSSASGRNPPASSASTADAETVVAATTVPEDTGENTPSPSQQTSDDQKSDKLAPRPAKRPSKGDLSIPPPPKRSKSMTSRGGSPKKGQQSLMGFFKPKGTSETGGNAQRATSETVQTSSTEDTLSKVSEERSTETASRTDAVSETATTETESPLPSQSKPIVDPIASKESWSKLFAKKAAPLCEDHQEPCLMLTTKKPGVNCGRAFWICPRPLGPSGQKEKGTQWRCGTFIWASDWNGGG